MFTASIHPILSINIWYCHPPSPAWVVRTAPERRIAHAASEKSWTMRWHDILPLSATGISAYPDILVWRKNVESINVLIYPEILLEILITFDYYLWLVFFSQALWTSEGKRAETLDDFGPHAGGEGITNALKSSRHQESSDSQGMPRASLKHAETLCIWPSSPCSPSLVS